MKNLNKLVEIKDAEDSFYNGHKGAVVEYDDSEGNTFYKVSVDERGQWFTENEFQVIGE